MVGKTRPTVKFTAAADGTPLEIGQPVSCPIDVSDPDGGAVDCTKVSLQLSLGHSSHAHPDQIVTPDANCQARRLAAARLHDDTAPIVHKPAGSHDLYFVTASRRRRRGGTRGWRRSLPSRRS